MTDTPAIIAEFRGLYRFLSNFYPAVVTLDGEEYPTVENAYQAAKSVDPRHRTLCRVVTPGLAKDHGQNVRLRDDWESMKDSIMLALLQQKFSHDDLAVMLLATNNAVLREGNNWGDTYWGIDRIKGGQNKLGKLLMQVRNELRHIVEDTL